jgi:hypothetical protein
MGNPGPRSGIKRIQEVREWGGTECEILDES